MKDIYCYYCGQHVGKLNTPSDVDNNSKLNILRKGTKFVCDECTVNNKNEAPSLDALRVLMGMGQ